MNRSFTLTAAAIALFLIWNGASPAQEKNPPDENWPPSAYPLSRYEKAWSRNPFDLKTIAPAVVAATPAESFARNLVIAGVSKVGDKDTLILFDLQASRYLKVTSTPNREGLRLVAVEHDPDIRKVVARIAKGNEEAELRYPAAPPAKRNGSTSPPNGGTTRPESVKGGSDKPEEASGRENGRNPPN